MRAPTIQNVDLAPDAATASRARGVTTRIAAGIQREYGLAVEVVADRPPPVDAVPPRPRGRVLDADALIAQGQATLGERARAPGVRGFLVITAADIADGHTNYVFGLADPGRGVMSTARFTDGAPRANERRALAQALSSTGLILAVPRCSTPTCARAHVSDVLDHDAKQDALCEACVDALIARR